MPLPCNIQSLIKYLVWIFLLIGLLTSCNQKKDEEITVTEQVYINSDVSGDASESSFLISPQGDTLPDRQAGIPTGVPIYIKGKRINPDRVAKPKTIPLKGKPKVVPAHRNVHLSGKPLVVQIPSELTVVTPGKHGIPLPKTIPAQGKVVPAHQKAPVPALPLQFKDKSTVNIKYLNEKQGLGSPLANYILEDSRGHIWIGTSGGGVSRYDGNSFMHYNKREGLNDFSANPVLEDSRGNIWFRAGEGGAICYDGHNFTHYTAKEGFPVIEDKQGNIWFGTGEGASRFDGTNFTYYTKKEGLSGKVLKSILEDSQGNLWFGTDGGACRFDGNQFTHYTKKEGLNGDSVYSILEDNKGNLWFGTYGGGVSYYDGSAFTHYTEKEGLISNYVLSVLEDKQGNIWIGAVGGVSHFNGTHFTNYTEEEGLSHRGVDGLLEDSQGNLWVGTEGGGINLLDIRTNFVYIPEIEGLEDNRISAIHSDSRGNLWFGTWRGGVSCYDGTRYIHYTEKEGLISNRVQTILEDSQGSLWFGTNKGASRFDPDKDRIGGTFTNYTKKEGLSGESIFSILEDNKGDLWFGSRSGGVSCYNGNTFTHYTEKEGLAFKGVSKIMEDSQGNLWFGANKGACRFDLDEDRISGIITNYSEKEGLPHNGVQEIIKDSRGNIWFGTKEGVCYFNGQNFATIPLKEGWWQHSYRNWGKYNSIQEDHLGRLWVSRERALSLIVPISNSPDLKIDVAIADSNATVNRFQIYDYGKNDGLKDFELIPRSVCIDDENRIWWGGGKGIIMLDLNQFELPSEPPKVRFNHIEIAQQFVDYRRMADTAYQNTFTFGKKISQSFDSVVAFYNYPVTMTLPYDLNHLTFFFTSIDWAAPQKIQYSYLIEGLDKDWNIPQSEPKADYRNLPHGTYTFKVKAIGEAQIWSKPFKYTFTILPPWYRTWWAYLLYILTISTILYYIQRYELRRQLAQAEAHRLQELDEVKNRLYTNITHEFRTPLTIILGMVQRINAQPAKWLEDGLNMIQHNGQNLLRLVNQMLDLSKLESGKLQLDMVQGDIIQYLRYVVESFHSYAGIKEIRLHFHSEAEELFMDYDPDNLLNIASNLLSNAVKFTKKGGDVYLFIEKKSELLSIEISDTGIGISRDRLPFIFDRFYQVDDSSTRKEEGTGIGLAIAKELVKLMDGEIKVKSTLGKGSEFTVLLPIHHKAPQIADLEKRDIKEEVRAFTHPRDTDKVEIKMPMVSNSEQPTVLIVEDNADVVRYLLACLESDYQCEVAYNGQEGIEKALEVVPDIIISDVMMPEKDGFEVCNFLKNDERTSHIPIVLLTAKADIASKITGLKRGADAYLPKPFNEEELLVQMENLIEQRKKLQLRYQGLLPEPVAGDHLMEIEDAFLQKIKNLIEENLIKANFDITRLAHKAGMSRIQLFRKIKALTGKSPSMFVRSIRLQKAKTLLLSTSLNISEITYDVGYSTPAFFSRIFRDEFGKSPTEFRQEHIG